MTSIIFRLWPGSGKVYLSFWIHFWNLSGLRFLADRRWAKLDLFDLLVLMVCFHFFRRKARSEAFFRIARRFLAVNVLVFWKFFVPFLKHGFISIFSLLVLTKLPPMLGYSNLTLNTQLQFHSIEESEMLIHINLVFLFLQFFHGLIWSHHFHNNFCLFNWLL